MSCKFLGARVFYNKFTFDSIHFHRDLGPLVQSNPRDAALRASFIETHKIN